MYRGLTRCKCQQFHTPVQGEKERSELGHAPVIVHNRISLLRLVPFRWRSQGQWKGQRQDGLFPHFHSVFRFFLEALIQPGNSYISVLRVSRSPQEVRLEAEETGDQGIGLVGTRPAPAMESVEVSRPIIV